jgi:hypothetical protein
LFDSGQGYRWSLRFHRTLKPFTIAVAISTKSRRTCLNRPLSEVLHWQVPRRVIFFFLGFSFKTYDIEWRPMPSGAVWVPILSEFAHFQFSRAINSKNPS